MRGNGRRNICRILLYTVGVPGRQSRVAEERNESYNTINEPDKKVSELLYSLLITDRNFLVHPFLEVPLWCGIVGYGVFGCEVVRGVVVELG